MRCLMLRKSKAQGILEYTIMLAAVVAIIMAVMLGKGGVGSKIASSYNAMGSAVNNTTNDLTNTLSPST